MNLKKLSIMSFTDLMDTAFDLHRKHIGTSTLYLFTLYIIGFISALILLFIGVMSFGLMAISFFDFNDMGGSDILQDLGPGAAVSLIIFFAVFFILIFLFQFAKQVGIINIGSKAFLNKPVKFVEDNLKGHLSSLW